MRKFDVRQGAVVGEYRLGPAGLFSFFIFIFYFFHLLMCEYRVGPAEFVSGPTFVPRPDGRSEDDGYLLVTVLNGAGEGDDGEGGGLIPVWMCLTQWTSARAPSAPSCLSRTFLTPSTGLSFFYVYF